MARLSRPALLTAPLWLLAACNTLWGLDDLAYVDSGSINGGGGSTSAAGGDASVGGSGGGDCELDDDCVDGDPCTAGSCEDGACAHVALAPGSPGTDEAACEGTCQTDGTCGLSLYERAWPDDIEGRPFNRKPLSLVWTGDDAPPPRGIVAAAHAHQDDQLIVFTDAGTTHIRDENGWTVAPTSALFDGLGATVLPNSATIYQRQAGDAQTLTVTTPSDGTEQKLAFIYVLAGGEITPDSDNPYAIQPSADPMAAAQESIDADWELSVQTGFVGMAAWVVFWRSYEGDVYEVDGGNFTWVAHGPDAQSPIWTTGGPSAGTTRAAYQTEGQVYLVAP